MNNLEMEIDKTCDQLDKTTNEQERKVLEAKIFELVEKLNGSTIYLTVQ